MFEAVDTSGLNFVTHAANSIGDRKITFDEFQVAVPIIEEWGAANGNPFTIDSARAEFDRIDADHSGAIRFDEFSQWALQMKLRIKKEDEADAADVPNLANSIGLLASASQEAFNRRRDILEQDEYVLRQHAERVKPVVAPEPSELVPELPQVVKQKLMPEGGRGLSFEEKRAAQCFVERYTREYKTRMLNECCRRISVPKSESPMAIQKSGEWADPLYAARNLPLYQTERMLPLLEKAAQKAEDEARRAAAGESLTASGTKVDPKDLSYSSFLPSSENPWSWPKRGASFEPQDDPEKVAEYNVKLRNFLQTCYSPRDRSEARALRRPRPLVEYRSRLEPLAMTTSRPFTSVPLPKTPRGERPGLRRSLPTARF